MLNKRYVTIICLLISLMLPSFVEAKAVQEKLPPVIDRLVSKTPKKTIDRPISKPPKKIILRDEDIPRAKYEMASDLEEAAAPQEEATPPPKIDEPKPYKRQTFVVVLDPGHGGHDPGAVGTAGTKEKDIVFVVAKEVEELLNREKGFKAFVTREGNHFVTFGARLRTARKNHADMFISFHADACMSARDVQGVSVYALSQRGATSVLARWLAKKENESELGHVIADKDLLLKTVLIDLAQTLTINNSVMFGNILLKHLSCVTKLHQRRVEQAAFAVLKSPDIPSLLIELGFLSSPIEEEKLLSPEYRHNIALAIVASIKEYRDAH